MVEAILKHGFPGSAQADADGMPEAKAIRQACGGDAHGFERLYRLHCRRVYAICLRITASPAEAEDLTQEAFLQLFRKIHTFRGESKFSTWLHRLTVNVVLMRLRKKRHPEVSLDTTVENGEERSKFLMDLGAPDLRLNGAFDRINLSNAVNQLPDGYRRIFILHDVEGYENKEIARILGCSVGNCKSQLFKARLRLRELLQEVLRSQAREKRKSMPS